MRAHRLQILVGILLSAGFLAVANFMRWRRDQSPCPYGKRLFLAIPHPGITRRRLLDILSPRAGERLLEVGPGAGYYTINVAGSLSRSGRLTLLDLQQKMLDHTMHRVAKSGLSNVIATLGDAQSMPFPDDSFDGAYVVAALGEMPAIDAALRQFHRVIKSGGRLIVGEAFPDPHVIRLPALQAHAATCGLSFEMFEGSRWAYFARFRVDKPAVNVLG